MVADSLPKGFRWTWAGGTVRINLPPVVRTESHCYEPILSRADVELVALAVADQERIRRSAVGKDAMVEPLVRVIVAHDPRYSTESLREFRMRLSLALIEHGQNVIVDPMVTLSDMDLDLEGPSR